MEERPERRRLSCPVVDFVDISNLVRFPTSGTMTPVGNIESPAPSVYRSAIQYFRSSACSDGTATSILERRIKGRPPPGRMFYREKSVPTRGEKRLVNGILQNRGFSNEDAKVLRDQDIEHQNAWRIAPCARIHSDKDDDSSFLTVRSLNCRTREEQIEEMESKTRALQSNGEQRRKYDQVKNSTNGIHIYLPRIEIDES